MRYRPAVMTAVLLSAAMAFHYATPLSAREVAWYSRFGVLVTHDPLPPEQVAALHARGTKLLLYEWSVAYYASLPHWDGPVLNEKPLRGHAGAKDADAFYYDPAAPEHARDRPRAIAAKLRAIGYDGVFLDTTTAANVHPAALAEYRRRHPDRPYDAAFADFLRALRKEVAVIATNQGYRDARDYLPYVDFDVTESLITVPRHGRFVFRPRRELDAIMARDVAPAKREFPHVRFVHLNYVSDPKPRTIARIVAIARSFGDAAFVTAPHIGAAEENEAYFR